MYVLIIKERCGCGNFSRDAKGRQNLNIECLLMEIKCVDALMSKNYA